MIIDNFGVFFDDVAASASMSGKTVNVQPYAGREDPLYISILAKGANTGAVAYTVTVEQSADNSAFTAAGGVAITKPDAAPVLKAIRLPAEVKEKYVRLKIAVSGTPTGTVFAAVTRDHFAPYDEGLHIDRGRAIA